MTTSDEEVIDLLHEFCEAFAEQDRARLHAVFAEGNVCFVASDGLALHDRAHLDDYFDTYAAEPVSFSFEWDACQVSADERSGWIVAFGREIRHEGEEESKFPVRMTLGCTHIDTGWRIAHLHASKPTG